jgi:hypothetical protein
MRIPSDNICGTSTNGKGGVEFEYLQGARFVLQQCRTCGLIFQGQIGNDVLMHKLYEEWIDPAHARALGD